MDKMIEDGNGEVIITNDGATILSHMQVFHPTAKMLVELARSQDIEAGDGTTSVTVLAGSLLNQCSNLLLKGIHPTAITEAFQLCVSKAEEILTGIAIPVSLEDKSVLVDAATTSLSSKVVSQYSEKLAPLAVEAVLAVMDSPDAENVDLNKIKVVKAQGGTIDETELVNGLVFNKRASHTARGPVRITNAKIGLIQFCLTAPKTDLENSVVVSEYAKMDRILREERKHILKMCKAIQKTGCNVLLIQKSVLREAVNDLSLHFLSKLKIMVVTNIERSDIEFISQTVDCKPVAHIDQFTPEMLGHAEVAEEKTVGASTKVVKITGVPNPGRTISMCVRGSNPLVLEETDRSIHDALCVIRSVVKKRFMIVGGGAPETEVRSLFVCVCVCVCVFLSLALCVMLCKCGSWRVSHARNVLVCAQISLEMKKWAKTLTGMHGHCAKAFAEAMELIPYTLAENAGMHPIAIVTELRRRHAEGEKMAGINVKRGIISDMAVENVIQPLLVSTSAIKLAAECVCMILKIDDLVAVR